MFTFATVSPHPVARAAILDPRADPRADLAAPVTTPPGAYAWKIISLLPLHDLAFPPGRFLADNAALYSAMLALLAVGSFLLARARVHHHQAELQSEHERRFRRTLEDIDLAVKEDITERKRLEQEVATRNRELAPRPWPRWAAWRP
ncbi:MAG: hypothetical protein U9Q81_13320 [Pseudomonadota bacterium]|nr:hypothetical protein [Pseudomonadota bacterium]